MSTASQRIAWAPACKPRPGSMRDAYTALDNIMKRFGYKPEKHHTGAFNCRKITGGTGWSQHAFLDGERFTVWTGFAIVMALAVDYNWLRNPYGKRLVTDMPRAMIEAILAIRTVDGLQVWGWGGNYSGNKDAMHFDLLVTPDQLRRGIRGGGPANPAQPDPPSGAKCPDPGGHPIIRQGAKGRPVNHLQHYLIHSGAKIRGDGDFGPATKTAVINHQKWLRDVRKEPVVADGIVGPKTWQAIHNWADGAKI